MVYICLKQLCNIDQYCTAICKLDKHISACRFRPCQDVGLSKPNVILGEKPFNTVHQIDAINAGMRGRVITDRKDLWKGDPYKPLTEGIRKTGGRNAQGRITSYHRGGAHKRLYRIIDFKRNITGAQGTLERIEYDPNRTARIALARYPAGEASTLLDVQRFHACPVSPCVVCPS